MSTASKICGTTQEASEDREYKRIKIKACEMDSPFAAKKMSAGASTPVAQRPVVCKKPRQLNLRQETCDYEYLSNERKKKQKIEDESLTNDLNQLNTVKNTRG